LYKKESCRLLQELDREFSRTTQEKGIDGWVYYFAEDGEMAPAKGEIIKGKDAIRKAMAPFFQHLGNSLVWEPESAEVSEDESMGYTYGKYIRTTMDEAGNTVIGKGRYTSIWRKQKDGKYRIIFDIGN
jgi:ketosteroid isomerase-like protein